MWPDLAKNRHFGIMLKAFDYLLRDCWTFDQILNIFWQNLCAFGQILIATNVIQQSGHTDGTLRFRLTLSSHLNSDVWHCGKILTDPITSCCSWNTLWWRPPCSPCYWQGTGALGPHNSHCDGSGYISIENPVKAAKVGAEGGGLNNFDFFINEFELLCRLGSMEILCFEQV